MPSDSDTPGQPLSGRQRLQKILAAAGKGSRRACEELIAAGRVTVDGRVAMLGDRADPEQSTVCVDGDRVVTSTNLVYVAMNKPVGVVSTMSDERGRAALADFLGHVPQRVFHVGRLDADSEGLLLLTNDGTLGHRLTHPSFGVRKVYQCEVAGPVPRSLGRLLKAGIELEDGPVAVDDYRLVDAVGRTALLEITIHEGRKHIVRRMLAEAGHPVSRLIRTAIGPVRLGDLKPGRTRRLTAPEIAGLFKLVEDADGPGDDRPPVPPRPAQGGARPRQTPGADRGRQGSGGGDRPRQGSAADRPRQGSGDRRYTDRQPTDRQPSDRGGDRGRQSGDRGGDWGRQGGDRGGDWGRQGGDRGGDWGRQPSDRGGDRGRQTGPRAGDRRPSPRSGRDGRW